MSVAKTRELTSSDYWNDQWRRLRPSGDYGSLKWVERNYVYRSLDRLFHSVLPADPTKTFVEMGSGPARWMVYFHKRFGYRVFGCDYSHVSCELARANLTRAGVPGEVVQGDFFNLPGSYDVVFSGGVVEHFARPEEPLRAFAERVKPGGYLVTSVPNLGGLNGLYQRWFKPETFETHRAIGLSELRAWHRRLGLEEVLATSFGSISITRLPGSALRRFPLLQKYVWNPLWVVALRTINRFCLMLHRLGIRLDHPLISPHLLVISRKPSGGIA